MIRKENALLRLLMVDGGNQIAAAEMQQEAERFTALKEKGGAVVISASQLFPTPEHIAAQMVRLAEIEQGHKVLEPSAGTGRILDALPGGCKVTAVEIDTKLQEHLYNNHPKASLICGDFLKRGFLETFDRVIMNPPFKNGVDIKHILKAYDLLSPGGVLVALCAAGPRQREALLPLCDHWEQLPPRSFVGTNVNVLLLKIYKV